MKFDDEPGEVDGYLYKQLIKRLESSESKIIHISTPVGDRFDWIKGYFTEDKQMSLLLRFDPEGGELGRGVKVTALELAIVAPHIASILQALHDQDRSSLVINEPKPYKYGFEVWLGDARRLEIVLDDIILPKNVKWYTIDGGKRIFELRGLSGGVTSGLICYLITQ